METKDTTLLDSIITKLLNFTEDATEKLQEKEIKFLVEKSKEIFLAEPTVLKLKAPITICGDIRGNFKSLKKVFELSGDPKDKNYVFLGNYINTSENSLECLCLLLAYKIKYKNTFNLLRGHYDAEFMCKAYGFEKECQEKTTKNIYEQITALLDCLPLASTLDDKIFLVHGGISPQLKTLDQIEGIQRPIVVPKEGLVCDLIWSDPDKDMKDDWSKNSRGAGQIFGEKPLNEFLEKNGFIMLCRGHTVINEGYEYLWGKKLLTIFSCPKFCSSEGKGAIMEVDSNLKFEPKIWE